MATPPLTRFAWLSIAAAVATIALKTIAYLLTGSVGLLSDAVESLVNLVGAIMALSMLTVAARPADEEHAYGHSKAEYFSSGVEGTLILMAALAIGIAAVPRVLGATADRAGRRRARGLRRGIRGQSRGRARAASRREAAPLHHARGERAAPPHRRVDLSRRHCRRGRRRGDGLPAPGPHRRPARGGEHRVDRGAHRSTISSWADGHVAAGRRTRGRPGGAGQPFEGRRRVPCAPNPAVRGQAVRVVPRAGARRVDRSPGTRAARGDRGPRFARPFRT